MSTANGPRYLQTQALDWLFSQAGAPPTQPQPSAQTPIPAVPDGSASPAAEPPPPIRSEADLQAATEWLRRERERLQQYTDLHINRIKAEHQALVDLKYRNEQTLLRSCQEVSRKEELLAQQSRVLQHQEKELSERELALSARLEEWSRAQSELGTVCRLRDQTEEEAASTKSLLDTLRSETIALQKSRETMQTELEGMARSLEEQREARIREQARTQALQTQMEDRLRELARAEQSAQRRVNELDDLEKQLRKDFEEQEQQLAEQRRELATLYPRPR
jgi:hypothetical protein